MDQLPSLAFYWLCLWIMNNYQMILSNCITFSIAMTSLNFRHCQKSVFTANHIACFMLVWWSWDHPRLVVTIHHAGPPVLSITGRLVSAPLHPSTWCRASGDLPQACPAILCGAYLKPLPTCSSCIKWE